MGLRRIEHEFSDLKGLLNSYSLTVKASVCLAKDLKNSFFLSQIYSFLSYILLIYSSFLFLFFFFSSYF